MRTVRKVKAWAMDMTPKPLCIPCFKTANLACQSNKHDACCFFCPTSLSVDVY